MKIVSNILVEILSNILVILSKEMQKQPHCDLLEITEQTFLIIQILYSISSIPLRSINWPLFFFFILISEIKINFSLKGVIKNARAINFVNINFD